jgi:FAD/FMN-containing dehydrogenase
MRLSRRSFVGTLGRGSLVVGFNALTGSWVAAADGTPRAPFDGVPRLDGTLFLDEPTRQTYARDYGQVIHKQPSAVLRPGSVDDIRRIVDFARRHGLRIAARGQGHQPFGQAQVDGGVLIDMRSLRAVHSVSADHVDVEAGADWRMVVQAALGKGSRPPVLTAYLGLTVGGTLSIGGVGTTTSRHGAQVDHVLELQVVTGNGQVLTCSETRHRDLFEAALAGQGQCAIITRVVSRLTPASSMVREYVLHYPDVPTLLKDGALLRDDRRFHGVVGVIAPSRGQWAYSLIATREFSPPDVPNDAALKAGLSHVPGSEQARDVGYLQQVDGIPNVEFGPSRPDLGLCLPGSMAASFIGAMLLRLTPGDLGTAAGIRVFFWKQGPFSRPLLRLPAEETFVYVATLRSPTTDPGLVARMLAGNRILFDRTRELGGTLYPFSAVGLSDSEWRHHYGPVWPRLAQAKQRHDPDRVLASGPDLFREPPSR